MDKGRQIDHNQNVNARFIDNFGTSQKTSVKIANPPGKSFFKFLGGKSSFSLGWDNNAEVVKPSKKKAVEQNNNNNQEDPWSTSSTYGNAKKKPVENYGNNFTNQNVKNVYNVSLLI